MNKSDVEELLALAQEGTSLQETCRILLRVFALAEGLENSTAAEMVEHKRIGKELRHTLAGTEETE